jgi:hypothetical protein
LPNPVIRLTTLCGWRPEDAPEASSTTGSAFQG